MEFYRSTNEIESMWKKEREGGGGDKRIWIDRCFDWDKLEGVIFSERFIFFRFEMEKTFHVEQWQFVKEKFNGWSYDIYSS